MKIKRVRQTYNITRPQLVDDAAIVLDLVGQGDLMGEIDRAQWNDPPTLFQQNGRLMAVEEVQRRKDNWELYRDQLNPSKLKTWLSFQAAWERTRTPASGPAAGTPMDEPIPPPDGVVEHLFNMGHWPLNCFPPLRGVAAAPAVRLDGSVLDLAGYDRELEVYLRPARPVPQQVENNPPDSHVNAAREFILDDLLEGFDFAGHADRANAVALLLTGLLRWGPCSDDLFPMAVLDASMQGSGKGTLAALVSQVWGGSGAMAAYPDTERELKLNITSILMTDEPVVIWDNVERDIDSAGLAGLLTSKIWSDRILGGNDWFTGPNDKLWMVTGNNIKLGRDLPRRSIWIRQEPKINPTSGKREFKHTRLLAWVEENLGNVWWALLTLIRRWVSLGMPDAQSAAARSTTTFDDWARKLGGILECAGIDGFLENRETLLHDDTASEELQMFVEALAREFPNAQPFKARDVVLRLSEPGTEHLMDSLPTQVRASVNRNGDVAKSLGKWLEHHRKQLVDSLGGAYIDVMDGTKPKQFFIAGGSAEVYTGGGLSVVAEAYKALQL